MIPGLDRRVWMALAFATLIATFAGLPYAEFLVAGGPVAARAQPALPRLALQVLLTVFGTWPLAALGLALGARLGLGAPLLTAWFADEPVAARARTALVPAALLGLGLGAILLVGFGLGHDALEAQFLGRTVVPPPAWAGVLAAFAAGVNEEVLLRLFLLTAIAASLSAALPRAGALWSANIVAALVFGALHFGNVHALGLTLSVPIAATVLALNGVVGLLCGWLYWTRGIEAAMAAHVAADLMLHGVGPALAGRL